MVVRKVRAEEQSRIMNRIIEGQGESTIPFLPLTPSETSIVSRGRNCVKSQPSRLSYSKEVYQDATSLECLLGYLYLEDCEGERFRMMADWVRGEILREDEE
ncbi:hypothetical protein TrCOL_g9461 [Triparma columacea]|uniref:RNase III domain-containing protein n=1 Tax=Triparma columacea TaxID=722753 RepID=A0A9W7G774_9STRA|nr:hypothetical protein TrCOL_g9461 [Triparma columacea]